MRALRLYLIVILSGGFWLMDLYAGFMGVVYAAYMVSI